MPLIRNRLKVPVKKPRKVPKMILPKPIAARYNRNLQVMITAQLEVVKTLLFPHIEGLIDEADLLRPKVDSLKLDQDWAVDAARLLAVMNLGIDEVFIQNRVEPMVEQIGVDTSIWHQRQWNKMVRRSIGTVLLTREPWLPASLTAFTETNVALITNLNNELKTDIKRILMSGIQEGKRAGTIRKEILSGTPLQRGRFRKTRNRAELIAVDQVLTFNGELNQLRQRDVGVERYKWRDSRDERVRGRPGGKFPNARFNHWDREGKIYSWNKPPADGHPGMPTRCRCFAEPIFDDIVEGFV